MYKIPANSGFKSNLVHYLPSCHSTNEITANLLTESVEEGLVVITDEQTDGKGQRSNTWESDSYKNLTFSLVLTPTFLRLQNQFQLTQAVSIAIATVVQTYVAQLVKIKWPNDIYVGDRKIAGILIQNNVKGKEIEYAIIGIGLNVNQVKFTTPSAISLKMLKQKNFDLNSVFNSLIDSIFEHYELLKRGNVSLLKKEYHQLLYGLNEIRNFENDSTFAGKIIGTDPLGRLLIETSKGVKCYQNQEVKLI